VFDLHVAVAGNGDAIAAWIATSADNQSRRVEAAIRPAGRPWQRPQKISGAIPSVGLTDLAIDRGGNAIAVWNAGTGSADVIQQALRRAGGRFRPPTTIATTAQSVVGSFGSPRIAVDGKGAATAVWAGGPYNGPVVQVAQGTARRGLGPARGLARGIAPVVATNTRGDTTVAWVAPSGVQAASRRAGGRFGAPQTLGAGASPTLAVNDRGDAVVAWGDGYPQVLYAAVRKGRGRFGAAERVGSGGNFLRGIDAAIDPRGAAVVLWQSDHDITFPVEAAVRPSGGRFGESQVLSTDGQGFSLGLTPRGDAVAVWSRYAGDYVVQSATRAPGRIRFGPARDLSQLGYNALDPALSLNGRGQGVAAWQRSQGKDFVVQALDYRAASSGGTG
jgi:hypothetical protein